MTKLDAFRKLIREEVRAAVREELKGLLTEIAKPAKQQGTSYTKQVKEPLQRQSPKLDIRETALRSSDPIQRLLAETAMGMDADEYRTMVNAGAGMAQGFPQMAQEFSSMRSPEPRVVDNVSDMLASAHPATDVSQVQIDTVPDFTGLMKTLKDKGAI